MTADEFQVKYHNYCVSSKEEAEKEVESIEVDEAIRIVHLSPLGYCLMLERVAAFLEELGMVPVHTDPEYI